MVTGFLIFDIFIKKIILTKPLMELSSDELKSRIDNFIKSPQDKPDKQNIKEALNQLQSIINSKETIYQVFEWKDNMQSKLNM